MADATRRLNGHPALAHAVERDKRLRSKILVPCSDEMVQRVQDYRFTNRFNSLSGAVRVLIERGLEAEEKRLGKPLAPVVLKPGRPT